MSYESALAADVVFVVRFNFHQHVGFSTKTSHIKNCFGALLVSSINHNVDDGNQEMKKQQLW